MKLRNKRFMGAFVLMLISCSHQLPKTDPFIPGFALDECNFGKISIEDSSQPSQYNFAPAVLCTPVDNKKPHPGIFKLGEDWDHYEWVKVTKSEKGKNYFGVLDYLIEGGMDPVPLFRSQDLGRTWEHVGDISKPHFAAQITKLKFSDDMNGEAFIEAKSLGFADSTAKTMDGGKTWRVPRVFP